jgi:hypothetical protein
MSMRPPSRDIFCTLQLGSLAVSWQAEGVSWSPDVADDIASRCLSMLRETLAEAHAYGLLATDNEVLFDEGDLAETTVGEDDDGE